jgi:GT2 family glycosyltransferase
MQAVVNIGIVTFNRLSMTKLCIESVFRHTKIPFMMTVVDNGSSDGTQEWLIQNSFPISNIILLDKNIGIAKASNISWKVGPKDYFVKLDNDIVIQEDGWLKELVDLCNTVQNAGAVAHSVEGANYKIKEANGMTFQLKIEGNLGGCSIMIPKRTFEKLGYWCEDYGLYGEEDADYGYRIIKLGMWNVYHRRKGIVVHLPCAFYPEIGHDEEWYKNFKDTSRKENLKAGSNYYKNLKIYNDNNLLKKE